MQQVTCQYCGLPAKLVGGNAIYPHRPDLQSLKFYLCRPCNAYVGCHEGTDRAKGSLADAPTREARKRAHAAFDPLWINAKNHRSKTRRNAYKWLSSALGIPAEQTHIGMFDEEMCNKVVQAVANRSGVQP